MKTFRNIIRAACAVAVVAAVIPSGASADLGTSVYPDLRVQGPSNPRFWQADLTGSGQDHHYLLISTRIWNAGAGAFELDRTPQPSLISTLTQRIYEQPAGFHDEPIGSVALDGGAFKAPDIARVEVWGATAFRRAQRRGFTRGAPLYSQYQSYCVADGEQVDPNATPAPAYVCSAVRQGISPGWRHVEDVTDTDEWIDFGTSPLPDGEYVVRAIVDPNDTYLESPGHADASREGEVPNSGYAYFRVIGGQLAGVE
jgi:hypothetical protein